MIPWWPWAADPEPPAPVAEPERPSPDLEAALREHRARWRNRALAADEIAVDAFHRYGRYVPVDVLLDIHNAIRPPRLPRSAPVVPGRPDA